MKLTQTSFLFLLGLGAGSLLVAQEVKLNIPGVTDVAQPVAAGASSTPAAAAPAQPHTQAQILETLGWWMGINEQIDTFNLNTAQIDSIVKGFRAAAAGQDSTVDLDSISAEVEAFVAERQEAYVAQLKAAGEEEEKALFEMLQGEESVTKLPSGLAYQVLTAGTGEKPKATDTVTVNYRAMTVDGAIFDSNFPADFASLDDVPAEATQPVTFQLSTALDAWQEGLQYISKGGTIRLYSPAKLAYGDAGHQNLGIPPGTAVVFEIELLDFRTTPGPASAN